MLIHSKAGRAMKRRTGGQTCLEVKVREPFDFSLYPQIFDLAGYKLPFEYTPMSWRSMIIIEDELSVPVQVEPLAPDDSRSLIVSAYCDLGTEQANAIEASIRSIFCTDSALERDSDVFKNGFGRVFSRYHGLKPHLSQDPFQSLIKIIARQLVSSELAKRAISNLTVKFGERGTVGSYEIFAFPSPARLAKATKSELLSCGVGFKWRTIQKISKDVVRGDLDLRHMQSLSSTKVIEELEERVGVGRWSSRVFLFDGLHRMNDYPIFDITIQRAFSLLERGAEGSQHRRDWSAIGPTTLAGFYATYLFAYFRDMRRAGTGVNNEGQIHSN